MEKNTLPYQKSASYTRETRTMPAQAVDVLALMQKSRPFQQESCPAGDDSVNKMIDNENTIVVDQRNEEAEYVEIVDSPMTETEKVTEIDDSSDDGSLEASDSDDQPLEVLILEKVEDFPTKKSTTRSNVSQDGISAAEVSSSEDDAKNEGISEISETKADFKESQLSDEPTEKQRQKEKEKRDQESKKQLEKQKREKAKELERKQKELKRLEKEEEKRKKEEEKLRIKRENDLKKEQQKKERLEKEKRKQEEKEEKERKRLQEKEDREKKKQEEKEERERKRLEEKEKKEEERRKQEEQKKQEEETKLKNEKKLQISNFFKTKTVIKSSSIEKMEKVNAQEVDSSISDFSKNFRDFYLKDGTTLYDFHKLTGEKLQKSIDEFDTALGVSSSSSPNLLFSINESLDWLRARSSTKQSPQPSVTAKQIFESSSKDSALHFRYIKFYENVQAYYGTFTKPVGKDLALNPFILEHPIFIDFDDEGDENEEGEGEDIDDLEDEEEEEEDDEEDIDDFLEQDSSPVSDNPKVLGPLIPKVSWRSENEEQYGIEILVKNVEFPINPKRNYWEMERTNMPESPSKPNTHSLSNNSTPMKSKKSKALILDKNDLQTFLHHVNQSDYTIPTMVEILKKHLPGYTKSTIENTLKSIAKRVGPKPTEKKWEVNTELLSQLSQQTAESES